MSVLGLSAESVQILIAFACYLTGVALLGVVSHRLLAKGDFVKGYFIGNRGLGAWVLALSVAGTAISGGSFVGFPALIYTHGYVMALWIASYMVVPLMAMALIGKRLNQVARLSGAITVPDVFRDRFGSPTLGLLATALILSMLLFNMVAQFKGGSLVFVTALGLPPERMVVPVLGWEVDKSYLIGLLLFAFTVVAYTTFGGFWAVTLTDVLEGAVKLIGVVLLAILAVRAVLPVTDASGQTLTGLGAATERLRQQDPALVSAPGPGAFLPVGMAFSFFLMWSLSSSGQPSNMVRLMSFKDTRSLRRGMIVVCGYYVPVYGCLLVVMLCARAIYPTPGDLGIEGQPDRALLATIRKLAPHPLLAGLLLASPYAAMMSAVAAFLLMVSSGVVRDIYQRSIHPGVSDRTMRRASYTVTALVGAGVMIAAMRPPSYLQYLIVFTGTGQSCSFLFPMLLSLYWRRATRQGVLAGMLGGFVTVVGLYVLGWLDSSLAEADRKGSRLQAAFGWFPGWGEVRPDKFTPLYAGGFDPLVWGLLLSLVLCVGVSLATRPDPARQAKYFPEGAD